MTLERIREIRDQIKDAIKSGCVVADRTCGRLNPTELLEICEKALELEELEARRAKAGEW